MIGLSSQCQGKEETQEVALGLFTSTAGKHPRMSAKSLKEQTKDWSGVDALITTV